MDKDNLDYFKTVLTDWLYDLRRHAEETVTGMRLTDVFHPDPLDRAAFDSERSFQLRIRNRESVLINKIKRSLEDIENGTYGICRFCEEEISLQRMTARPVATLCIYCKKALEDKEQRTGT
jgi:DnaK suppressor protein